MPAQKLKFEQDVKLRLWLKAEQGRIRDERLTQHQVAKESEESLGFPVTQGHISHRMGMDRGCLIKFEWPTSMAVIAARTLEGERMRTLCDGVEAVFRSLNELRRELGLADVASDAFGTKWRELHEWAKTKATAGVAA